MHSLDVYLDVRHDVPRGTDVRGQITARGRYPAPVVDVHPVRRRRGEFAAVEPGVGSCDDRPRVRVRGRFAGEVSSVELFERGVDVVGVEDDACRDLLVGVDLDDDEHLGCGMRRAAGRGPNSGPTEDEAFPAGRNGVRRRDS